MARKSISPGKLMNKMMDPSWLKQFKHGSVNMIHIYHDDGCPCEDNLRGFLACTCHTVEYELERVI